MRLLVIEDERDLCEDIAKKLRLSGYASSSRAAPCSMTKP